MKSAANTVNGDTSHLKSLIGWKLRWVIVFLFSVCVWKEDEVCRCRLMLQLLAANSRGFLFVLSRCSSLQQSVSSYYTVKYAGSNFAIQKAVKFVTLDMVWFWLWLIISPLFFLFFLHFCWSFLFWNCSSSIKHTDVESHQTKDKGPFTTTCSLGVARLMRVVFKCLGNTFFSFSFPTLTAH